MANIEEEQARLFMTCRYLTWEDVWRRLTEGAQVHWVDEEGYTVLHHACFGMNTDVVRKLLEREPRVHVNAQSLRDGTPLHIACGLGDLDTVNALLEWGADVRALGSDGNTPLHEATIHRRDQIVQKLVTCQNVDIDAQDGQGNTSLYYACSFGHTSLVQTLVDGGADVNQSCPLLNAVWFNYTDIIDVLLREDPDVNLTNSAGRTPLHIACLFNLDRTMKRLLGHGARVNVEDENGYTPLLYAARDGHLGIVRHLLEAGAKAKAIARNERRDLFGIVQGHCQVLRVLFEPGSDLPRASRYLEDACEETKHTVVLKVFVGLFNQRHTARGLCALLLTGLEERATRVVSGLQCSLQTVPPLPPPFDSILAMIRHIFESL